MYLFSHMVESSFESDLLGVDVNFYLHLLLLLLLLHEFVYTRLTTTKKENSQEL